MKKIILSFCISCFSIAVSAQSLTEKDRQFAKDAAQAGLLEVRLGELTITRASSPEVKNLGQAIVVGHTRSCNELKALALTKNITLPTELSDEGQKIYYDLAAKTGNDFDKAYASQALKDHEKVVANFKKENLNNSDTEIRNWAAITLPVLEHHMLMAKEADLQLNNTGK